MLSSLSPEQAKRGLALVFLLIVGALAIAGPTGLLAWRDSAGALEEHELRIAALIDKRDELRHRVDLLALDGTDADLAGELIRQNLNVVHPDEIVITLDSE